MATAHIRVGAACIGNPAAAGTSSRVMRHFECPAPVRNATGYSWGRLRGDHSDGQAGSCSGVSLPNGGGNSGPARHIAPIRSSVAASRLMPLYKGSPTGRTPRANHALGQRDANHAWQAPEGQCNE